MQGVQNHTHLTTRQDCLSKRDVVEHRLRLLNSSFQKQPEKAPYLAAGRAVWLFILQTHPCPLNFSSSSGLTSPTLKSLAAPRHLCLKIAQESVRANQAEC